MIGVREKREPKRRGMKGRDGDIFRCSDELVKEASLHFLLLSLCFLVSCELILYLMLLS